MSDTTSGPDKAGATPSDEAVDLPGDESSTDAPAPADADAEVPSDPVTDAAREPEFVESEAGFVEPDPEPVAAAEPVPEAVAEPFEVSEPDPVADPEPVTEPEPKPVAVPEPEPVAEPVPVAAPVAAAAPEPVIEPDVDADAARTARLDEAVQRANAGAVTSDAVGDADDDALAALAVTPSEPTPEPAYEPLPEPVAAESVRRETYIPPSAAAAGAVAGAATLAPEPLITPSTPAVPPQTIYVQAPVAPKSKGNRAFGVLVAAIGAVAFALIYAGVTYLLLLGRGDQGAATDEFVKFLAGPYWALFWVPTVALFVGFALLAAIVNRGPWWTYAVFGLLVGVLVYFSYIGASLLAVQAWTLTFDEAQKFIGERWLDPFAIVAGVVAREIPIWLGGWIAAHGRTVTERNRLALEAYDRELAAGPRPIV